ncbi:MAG: M48 family metallopeptidase [Caldilineaceae bacterium]
MPSITIIRSKNRTKTVSAHGGRGDGGDALATMGDEELTPIVEKLQKRLARRQQRRELDDDALARRAQELNRAYFQGKLQWESIRWVTNQNKRYGSCTPSERTIRISHRLAKVPQFVLDYVIVHELAHLLEANHGKRFWKLVNRYPKTERARGYLMAMGLEELDE